MTKTSCDNFQLYTDLKASGLSHIHHTRFSGLWSQNKHSQQLCPCCMFLLYEEGENEALEYFKCVIKIWPNREHIFQNKLRNTWTAILKISALLQTTI